MTHQIYSIDDYLHKTSELAKKNKSKKVILFFTMMLALLSLGFGIITSSEIKEKPVAEANATIIPISEENPKKFGKVFLAFDHEELNGIEDIDAYLNGEFKQESKVEEEDQVYPEDDWTDEGVRNQIVIKGNYYAGQ
ncbi:MAG: hypothetical protein AAF696_12370 [Bacteroidota bacterium]